MHSTTKCPWLHGQRVHVFTTGFELMQGFLLLSKQKLSGRRSRRYHGGSDCLAKDLNCELSFFAEICTHLSLNGSNRCVVRSLGATTTTANLLVGFQQIRTAK